MVCPKQKSTCGPKEEELLPPTCQLSLLLALSPPFTLVPQKLFCSKQGESALDVLGGFSFLFFLRFFFFKKTGSSWFL
jgi:hypothetical protein